MMNQYYGFGGRGSRPSPDRAPYRRPAGRMGLPGNPVGRMPGYGSYPSGSYGASRPSCGCGSSPESRGSSHTESHHTQPAFRPVEGRGGFGCSCTGGNVNDTAACKRLMEQIRAVDFALYETVLYLDVYPHSCDALETYHKLRAQSHALHDEYEASCGPLTAFGNRSDTSWDWMSKPCPWEYDAD